MIAGLPLASWILIASSVGLGLAIELRHYVRVRRSATDAGAGGRADRSGSRPPSA